MADNDIDVQYRLDVLYYGIDNKYMEEFVNLNAASTYLK